MGSEGSGSRGLDVLRLKGCLGSKGLRAFGLGWFKASAVETNVQVLGLLAFASETQQEMREGIMWNAPVSLRGTQR